MSKEIDETYSKTKNAIERSKVFLNSKLLPDLEQATSYLAHLQQSRENYIELRKKVDELRIRQNHSSHQDDIRLKEHTAEEKDYDDASSVPIMAPIGRGVQISTQIDPKSLLILVSSGLKESVQDWQVDSGLYLQLDQEETANFAETKIGILER